MAVSYSKRTLYVGSFLNSDNAPLYRCGFDCNSGEIEILEECRTSRPAWLCKAGENGGVFFALEAEKIDGVYGGGIGHFTDKMQSPRILNIGAVGPCHVCEDSGNIFLSCYKEGALVQVKYLSDAFSQDVKIIHHKGSGVNPVRQNMPHPHFSLFTPDGKFLAVMDLGLDKILLYPYTKEEGIAGEPMNCSAPAGSGPRHAVFSRDGKYLYVVTEMGGTVLTYEYNGAGGLKLIHELAVMLESEIGGEPQSAAIRLTPDGRGLIVTERRSGSIVFFSLDENGKPTRLGVIKTEACPRDAVFSPDGRWLICACQQADALCVYSYEEESKETISERVSLKACLKLPENSAPCCILFN